MNNLNPYAVTDKTVIHLENYWSEIDKLGIGRDLFMIEEFSGTLAGKITSSKDSQLEWFAEGVACSALIPGKIWQTGKIRIQIEFIPDSPEQPETEPQAEDPSPLDDIRQTLNLNS